MEFNELNESCTQYIRVVLKKTLFFFSKKYVPHVQLVCVKYYANYECRYAGYVRNTRIRHNNNKEGEKKKNESLFSEHLFPQKTRKTQFTSYACV